jgi:putative peptide zinc metalloprotease protein
MALRDTTGLKQDLDVPSTQEFELGDISPLDMASDQQRYLVDQKSGSYVCLSTSAYSLLKAVESGVSFNDLADTLNTRRDMSKISAEQLREAHEKIMEKLRASRMKPGKSALPSGFWLRFPLIPEQIVVRASGALAFLYQPFWAGIMIFFIVVSGVDLWRGGLFKPSHADLLIAYGIYLITLAVHELGHTAACSAFGVLPTEIGFTIYLIYPAFYSDVSSCWRLSRWRRVVVDLGGFYFQLVAGSICLLLYHITGWIPLWVAEIVIVYTAAFSLNPIFKFDGYWMLADMLGVANLGKQPLRIAKHFLALVLSRPRTMLPWPTTISLIVIAYSTISCVVWFLFALRLGPSLRYQLLSLFHSSRAIIASFSISGKPVWLEVEQLFFAVFQLTIVAVMCWNLGRRLLSLRAGSKGTAT